MVLVGDGAPRTLVCENETNAPPAVGRRWCDAVPEGRHRRPRRHWCRLRQRRRGRHQGRAVVRARPCPPAPPRRSACVSVPTRAISARRSRARSRPGQTRGRRVLRRKCSPGSTPEATMIARQALAGMMWTKQWFHFDVEHWLDGDPAGPPPPDGRQLGRNREWRHLNNADVITVCDTWEYPWYATWDLAFQCVAIAHIDAGVRQGPAAADVPRVVHAPQRSAARLRVGVRRREPTGARLGRAAGVRHRRRRDRHTGPRVPGAGLPQAAAELHVVGEPQGRGRRQRVRGRLPRDGQHPPIDRSAPLPVEGRLEQSDATGLDGAVLPQHAGDLAACSPSTRRRTRTWRPSSSSTSRTSPPPSTTADCGTTKTASTTTCCAWATSGSRCASARWSACCRCAP